MNQHEFFEHVLRELERLQVPYMVAGSVGAMIHSRPRLTVDMDVIVDLEPAKAVELSAAFDEPGYYLTPLESIEKEIERRGMFNLLHSSSGAKVDFILRKETPHAHEEFRRRTLQPFSDQFRAHAATPEDIMLGKLRYFREGGSEKHLGDIRSILDVRGDSLDFEYIESWVERLDLSSEWALARAFDKE